MNSENGDSYLSSTTTVKWYRELEHDKDTQGIVTFFKKRMTERYIKPFRNNKYKNGFIMMASACLLIEALESFWQGWKKSPNSQLAFCQFFSRNHRFDDLRGLSQEFYSNVRCGIIHQGETTGGWHIRRDLGTLFLASSKTIDATVFLDETEASLEDYCSTLRAEPWNGEVWKKFRKKMNNLCSNTKSKA